MKMVNFYMRFLPSLAQILWPLTYELRSTRKELEQLEWSAAMEGAFAAAKQTLLSTTHLVHPTVGVALSLVAHASATHVGACLQHHLRGSKGLKPLGFFS